MTRRAIPSPRLNRHLRALAPYPPGKPIEEVQREFGLRSVIKLASNENPLGPSPRALRALAAAVRETNRYPDGSGYYLRQALAERLGVAPDEIVLGNGSDELVMLLALCYLNPRNELVTSDYAFVRYAMAARLAGARPRLVPMRAMRHDLSALAAAIGPRTAMICLDIPCNPTGTIVARRELERFLERVPPRVAVVIDQAYHEYACDDAQYPDALALRARHPHLIVLRTFSKAYGLAGLRVGYAVMPAAMASDVDRVRPPFNVNRLAQTAALAALEDAAHVRRTVRANREGMRQLVQGLAELGVRCPPSHANFVLADLRCDARRVFQALLERGVITRPMDGYGLTTWLRITIGTRAQNRRCLAALRAVLPALRAEKVRP